MKRGIVLFSFIVSALILLTTPTNAGTTYQTTSKCETNTILINQDPYPAVPGEYLKVVFQTNGITDPTCGQFEFTIVEDFPFSLRPGASTSTIIQSGIYGRNFPNFLLSQYELLVDVKAEDGENSISTNSGLLSTGGSLSKIKDFNITIENPKTDFEVSVKDYLSETNSIVFEILNIGEVDVEAVTIEIVKQNTIQIKGSNRNIIGDLDSNEDTTFNFEAKPNEGEIKMTIYYTDQINVRRSLEKTIQYDPSYFSDRKRDETNISASTYFYLIIIAVLIFLLIKSKIRKRKIKKLRLDHHKD